MLIQRQQQINQLERDLDYQFHWSLQRKEHHHQTGLHTLYVLTVGSNRLGQFGRLTGHNSIKKIFHGISEQLGLIQPTLKNQRPINEDSLEAY